MNAHVTILAGGSVSGELAGIVSGSVFSGSVSNHGTVSGADVGISVQYTISENQSAQIVSNTGLISGRIGIEAVPGGTFVGFRSREVQIANTGTILGTTWAIALNDALSGSDRVENSGLIHGGVMLGVGNDVLVNAGRIVGNV